MTISAGGVGGSRYLAEGAARGGGHDRELELVGKPRLLGQRPAQDLVADLHRVDVVGLPDGRRAGVAAQMEAHDDPEVAGARAARGPQPVGVLVLVGVDELALGGDDVDADDAHAGGPDHAREPSPAALEQEAPQADGGAVAGGEEQAVIGEQAVELAAAHPGLDDRDPRLGVELHDPVQPREVDEERALAHAGRRPAVAARACFDLEVVRARVANRLDDVVDRRREHDRLRVARRLVAVPHRGPAGLLVSGRIASQQRRGRHPQAPSML